MHGDNTYTAAEKDRAITRKDLDAIANAVFCRMAMRNVTIWPL